MEPAKPTSVAFRMLDLLMLAAIAGHSPDEEAALALCRPALERKAGGQVNTIDVDAARTTDAWTIIRGPLTIFIGMGPAAPGTASTHHLIRSQYQYVCWVRGGRVRKTTLIQL